MNFGAQQGPLDLSNTWVKVEEGMEQIMNRLEQGLSYNRYMELYTLIYNYCTSSRWPPASSNEPLGSGSGSGTRGANLIGADLYSNLKTYFKRFLAAILSNAENHMDESLLIYYTKQWDRYTMASTLVHHIFRYLNRHWVKREIDEGRKHIYDVYTLSLVSWKTHLFMELQTKVMKGVLNLVERHRNGETIDTGLIKTVVNSFVALGLDENDSSKTTLDVYEKFFQEPFLAATEAYYQAESEKFISENSIVDYMKKAETRLAEEETRVDMFLHPSTRSKLIQRSEAVLIKSHMGPIQDEFQHLLNQDKLDDLKRMYSLLVRIPNGLDMLRTSFEAHVRKQGLTAVEKVAEVAASGANAGGEGGAEDGEEGAGDDEEGAGKRPSSAAKKKGKPGASTSDVDPKIYVDALLSVQRKYSSLVTDAFVNEPGFQASLDRACREYVNRNSVSATSSAKSPELLAKFCDALLKKSSKVAEEGEVEDVLNNIMVVFKYVDDKDVFQKFYSRGLARRLVTNSSASDDAEASMISKLREACGYEYTSKLQRMFTDMGVSKDLNDAFKDKMEKTHEKDDLLDFEIKVLGTAQWPLTPATTNFVLPEELIKTYERFGRFYEHKHSGRKLIWLFNHSKGELKSNYLKHAKVGYTFQVSTYQMAVLLQYNRETNYTWEKLLELTGLNTETLTPVLNLLVRAKVLLCDGAKVGAADSKYELNMDFKSKKIRVNLNLPIKSEQKTESEETHKTIEDDRRMLIQAAIVRIMKTRRTLKHQTLMTEVISQLQNRFKPKVSDIKKCIDILLEKEYMERNPDQKDMYNYMA